MSRIHELNFTMPDGAVTKARVIDRVLYGLEGVVISWVDAVIAGEVPSELWGSRPDERSITAPAGVPMVSLGILKMGWRPKDLSMERIFDTLIGGAYFFQETYWPDEDNRVRDDGPSSIWAAVASIRTDAGDPYVVERILEYPFRQRNHRVIMADIDDKNTAAMSAAKRLGFKRMLPALPGCGVDGGDRHLWQLRRDECPYWPPRKIDPIENFVGSDKPGGFVVERGVT